MKKVLGSLFLLVTFASASYTWSANLAKSTLYQYESNEIIVTCLFDSPATYMYVELDPRQDGVRFEKRTFDDRVDEGKRVIEYRFVVRVEDPNIKNIVFHPLMRQTTAESVKDTIMGRDNAHELTFDDTKVEVKSRPLTILPNSIALVGDFNMTQKVSATKVDAFEPVQVQITIEGKGNFDLIKEPEFHGEFGTLFKAQESRDLTLTSTGEKGTIVWHYAVVSDVNMTLAPIKIDFFDITTHSIRQARIESVPISVEKVDVTRLLDLDLGEDQATIDWKRLLGYAVVFIAGMLFYANVSKFTFKRRRKDLEWYELYTTPLALLHALIQKDAKGYSVVIERLEEDLKSKKTQTIKSYHKLCATISQKVQT